MKGFLFRNRILWIFVVFTFFCVTVLLSQGLCLAKENVKIQLDVIPDAQITSLEYFLESWKGSDRMHFKITLKNQSANSKRFKVSIYLDEGPDGAILFPVKGKKGMEPVIKSQEQITQTLPIVYEGMSKAFTIKVDEF